MIFVEMNPDRSLMGRVGHLVIHPYTITAATTTLAAALTAFGASLAAWVVGAAFLSGWSSAWSP